MWPSRQNLISQDFVCRVQAAEADCGDLRRSAGVMGVARTLGAVIFAAVAVFAAGEAPASRACDEDYQMNVCPEVCTSTLAEQ